MFARLLLTAASTAALMLGNANSAQSSAELYAGKTVKIVIGTAVGGEYGIYSQLIAQHIGKHVPGRPTVIVQPMPGAGGITALNYLASAAPRDGTVLTVAHVPIVQDGLLNPDVRFDPAKFQWIGRVAGLLQVGFASRKSNARSLADARERELVAGGAGANNPTALNPRILNVMAGTKFKIISGYRGTNEVLIAWERGEVDVVVNSWDVMNTRYGDDIRARHVNPLFVYGMKPPPELAGVPLMTEFGRNEAENAFLQIYSVGTEIGRSLAAPPGVPKEHVDIWRAAFTKMLDDPEFKEAIHRGKVRYEPLEGEKLAAIVANVVNVPADTVAKAREFYERLLAEVK